MEKELLFNLTKHRLVPIHEVLARNESEQFKKQYGTQILLDELNKLLDSTIQKYIHENNIEILGNPLPKDREPLDFEKQKDFEFVYQVGLAPKFTVDLNDKHTFTYKTVKIGNNVWMAENFKAKHFSNGDPIIEHILKIDKFDNVRTDFNGNEPFFSVLPSGNYVYSGGAISDPRGIAPIGWHLPTQADWEELGAISNSNNDFKSISGCIEG